MVEFKKLALLGKGSFAMVYLAQVIFPHDNISKVVVVKSSNSLSDSKRKKISGMFLGCQEIIQCYFLQLSGQTNYVTNVLFMEFVPYGSLSDLIKKRSLVLSEVRIYTHMLLKGLSYVHQKGIVYCNLKPDNILLFPSQEGYVGHQLKIADFGLSMTKEETIAEVGKLKFRGIPSYMSRESVMGVIDTTLDVWSIGCIVIEMITRFRVWRDQQTQHEIMTKLIIDEEMPPIPHGISCDCQHFLNKCFVKDHTQRWTAAMLLNHPFLYFEENMHRGYQSSPMISPSLLHCYREDHWIPCLEGSAYPKGGNVEACIPSRSATDTQGDFVRIVKIS